MSTFIYNNIKHILITIGCVGLIVAGLVIAFNFQPDGTLVVNSQLPTDEDLVKDRLGAARAVYAMISPNLRDEFMRQIDLCVSDEPISYDGDAVVVYNMVPSLVSLNSMELVVSDDKSIMTLIFSGTTDIDPSQPIFASAYLKLYTSEGDSIWAAMLSIRHTEGKSGEAEAVFDFPFPLLDNISEDDLRGMMFTLSVDFYPQVSSESSITIDGALVGIRTGGYKWLSLKIIDSEHYGAPICDMVDGFVGFGGGGAESIVEDITVYSSQTEYASRAMLSNYPSFVTVAYVCLYDDLSFSTTTTLYTGGLPISEGNGVDMSDSPLGISFTKDDEFAVRYAHWSVIEKELLRKQEELIKQQIDDITEE